MKLKFARRCQNCGKAWLKLPKNARMNNDADFGGAYWECFCGTGSTMFAPTEQVAPPAHVITQTEILDKVFIQGKGDDFDDLMDDLSIIDNRSGKAEFHDTSSGPKELIEAADAFIRERYGYCDCADCETIPCMNDCDDEACRGCNELRQERAEHLFEANQAIGKR